MALTTNGAALEAKAQALRDAGLTRITVSLDSLDERIFEAMNGVGMPLARVLDGIAAAREVGLNPIKLNVVVKRGVNDGGLVELVRFGRRYGHVVRFIEFMDVGMSNGWRLDDVVPAAEMIEIIHAEYPLEPGNPQYLGEVARRYRYRDGGGEIGVISSITQPFCHGCTRARLTSDGKLFTCLFAATGHDLRAMLRSEDGDAKLRALLARVWRDRTDRYSEKRSLESPPVSGSRCPMSADDPA